MAQRAALYCRVSTEAQAAEDRNSLDAQRDAFTARCIEREYTPTGEFTDVASGRRTERPSCQRLLAAARAGDIDVIVVTFLDRLGRRQEEIALRVLELRDIGVEVDVIFEDISDFLFLALSAWKADQESKRIGERVRLAAASAAAKGVPLERVAIGYRKAWDHAEDGRRINLRLEEEPHGARMVRDTFRWYVVDNRSIYEIARRLNAEGRLTATGREWAPNSVRNVLRRRLYTGTFTWAETVLEDAHPVLVTEELWRRAQDRLDLKSRLAGGRTQRSEYLLTGLLFCAHCAGSMNGNTTTPKGYSYRTYVCRNARRATKRCEHLNYHRADETESRVIDDLRAHIADVRLIETRVLQLVESSGADLELVDHALAGIGDRFRRNMELFERGAIATEDQLAIASRRLADEQATLELQRNAIKGELATLEGHATHTVDLPKRLLSVVEQLDDAPIQQQKAILQEAISRIELTEGDPDPRVELRLTQLG